MELTIRTESEIFSDLSELCLSPGYLHAIAYFCFRDNTIRYDPDKVTPENILEQYGMEHLLRTEISTLIGLTSKGDLNADMQSPETIQGYIDKTEQLLKEIHQSMLSGMGDVFDLRQASNQNFNPFSNGTFLRESIFYGGESAYHFQYSDLSSIKYRNDSDWLSNNKGYSSEDAISVITAIEEVQKTKLNEFIPNLNIKNPSTWTALDTFKFTAEDVSKKSNIDILTVTKVIESFISPIEMDDFLSLDDFNPKNAYPILKLSGTGYLLFQYYSLVEALYETPFFWFIEDKQYRDTAMKNRGDFTESFSAQKLTRVFRKKNVFLNVLIIDSIGNIAGEIDVLVVYANRAIILQAKSKRLTIASRKGNDLSLKDDFKKAVQDSYNQAYSCATLLSNLDFKLIDDTGCELKIERSFFEIYPFCVVSDHYPALSFQARQFLNFNETEVIKPPFIMDVFFLDVATEFLKSPLRFLSYINRRTNYNDKIFSNNELAILSYHLKKNLWFTDQYTMIHLDEDISAELDLAMLVRRYGLPGDATPEGILTKFNNTTVGDLITQIEEQEDSGTIDLGFLLLNLNEDTVHQINKTIDHIAGLTRKDHKNHDFTLSFDSLSTGLTIHCNYDSIECSAPRLSHHANLRKYGQKAKQWFGICLDPETKNLKFGLMLLHKWEQSDELDKEIADSPKMQRKINIKTEVKRKKIGRNQKCPCGSGFKYKKCCLE
jgi:hypothetical protein